MPKAVHQTLYKRSLKHIPGGVNSPVRAFGSVGGTPVFVRKAKGAFLWDETGKKYLDFCASWGPMIFGHAPKGLIETIGRKAESGTSFGAATRGEAELAEIVSDYFPSMQKLRLVSSGTEAVMSSVRLARGATGKKKILKVAGGYHGHVDSLLVEAGSGIATFGIPGSAGVPEELARLTLTVPFNDIAALEKVLLAHGKDIAAFILEPVPANMGVVPPAKSYLKKARGLTRKYGVLLIFDEVITGFRLSRGGAQEFYGVKPDLTCLGKIIGGGMPLAAFGGSSRIMDYLAPKGPVYQAGTLSGNPLAVSAALWTLKKLKPKTVYKQLNRRTADFTDSLRKYCVKKNYPVTINTVGSMFTLFFHKGPVKNYADAAKADTALYAKYFHKCLEQGVYLAPSQFEASFISAAHTAADLRRAMKVFSSALDSLFS